VENFEELLSLSIKFDEFIFQILSRFSDILKEKNQFESFNSILKEKTMKIISKEMKKNPKSAIAFNNIISLMEKVDILQEEFAQTIPMLDRLYSEVSSVDRLVESYIFLINVIKRNELFEKEFKGKDIVRKKFGELITLIENDKFYIRKVFGDVYFNLFGSIKDTPLLKWHKTLIKNKFEEVFGIINTYSDDVWKKEAVILKWKNLVKDMRIFSWLCEDCSKEFDEPFLDLQHLEDALQCPFCKFKNIKII